MNPHRTLIILFLLLALCACCLPPAAAILPSYCFRGTVTDLSRSDNTVTVLVTHKWGCEYFDAAATCNWKSISPQILSGTAPTPEVFDYVRIGSSVEAGSIGSQGERWVGIGVLTPSYSSEPLHATRLFGDLGILRAPLASRYSLAVFTQPDCGECAGAVCVAQSTNVTISRDGLEMLAVTLLPGEEVICTDPADGSGVTLTFVSGQASVNLCPDTPPGMSGVQPISVFVVHVNQGGPGPSPTRTPVSTGFLSVSSIPSGATIILDGVSKGSTPRTISGIEPGVHALVLEKDGYAPYERDVTISAGRPTTVTATLTATYGSLRIQSSPSGAAVLFNGTAIGSTPLVANDLEPGTYAVSLSKTGYETANRTVAVTPGKEQLLFVALSKKTDGSDKIDAFIAALQDEGFTVQQGKFEAFDVLAMYDAGVIPSCYGNNPSTPYLVYKLPGYPGLTQGGRVSDAPIRPDNKGLWLDYFMEPNEAIVFVGSTPPEVKYYSYRSYIGTRWFTELDDFERIFASLGDTVNNYRINVGTTPGQFTPGPYEKPVMIITTGDMGTNDLVRKAALKAGYPTGIINTDIIPSGLIRMGLSNTSDTITFIHRLAFFANETRGNEYLNGTPGYVFRLTPNTPHTQQPYGVPRLIVRGTGDTHELDLLKTQEALRDAIVARYGNGMVATANESYIWILEGYDSLQRESDALGDNRDAFYLRNGDYLLSDDDFVIVYGVNHQATGKVVYTNIAVYGTEALNGVVAVTDADIAGSANSYLPGNPNAGLFYVWKFARHCNGEVGCTEIPYCCGGLGIPADVPIRIGYRTYVEPGTGIGPTCTEILYDQAIHFSPV